MNRISKIGKNAETVTERLAKNSEGWKTWVEEM